MANFKKIRDPLQSYEGGIDLTWTHVSNNKNNKRQITKLALFYNIMFFLQYTFVTTLRLFANTNNRSGSHRDISLDHMAHEVALSIGIAREFLTLDGLHEFRRCLENV